MRCNGHLINGYHSCLLRIVKQRPDDGLWKRDEHELQTRWARFCIAQVLERSRCAEDAPVDRAVLRERLDVALLLLASFELATII